MGVTVGGGVPVGVNVGFGKHTKLDSHAEQDAKDVVFAL